MTNIVGGIFDTLPDEFMSILPNNYNLFFYRDNDSYIIYISETELNLKDISNNAVGYVSFVMDYDDSELTVTFIESKIPRVGIGHYLMLIIGYLANNQRIQKILLDDDSDLAHKGSIYQKIGCKYVNEEPNPEMECSPLDILNKYNEFYNKYVKRNLAFFKET